MVAKASGVSIKGRRPRERAEERGGEEEGSTTSSDMTPGGSRQQEEVIKLDDEAKVRNNRGESSLQKA